MAHRATARTRDSGSGARAKRLGHPSLRSAGGRRLRHRSRSRPGAFLLAYAGVILGGLLGAAIGYGVTEIGCHGHCGSSTAVGAIVGAIVGAVGTGVVAVLVLRAMAEWRRPKR